MAHKDYRMSFKPKSENALFLGLLLAFTIFAVIYSLYTPTWEESDGWFHWLKIKNTAQGNFLSHQPERQQPLYYFLLGGFLSFFDQADIESEPPKTMRNFFEDYNFFRHVSEDEFKYGEINFQRSCVGMCSGLSEEFPFTGVPFAVHFLRIFSIGFGLITLVFVFKISKIIFRNDKWLSLYPPALVAFIPQFTFINSVLASESLVITFSTIAIYYTLKFTQLQNNTSLILLSIFSGLALLTKVTSFFLIPSICLALIYLKYTNKISSSKFLVYFSIFLVLVMIIGGWWYLTMSNPISNKLGIIFDDFTDSSQKVVRNSIAKTEFSNLINPERHNFVYIESVWGTIGWKAIKTGPLLLNIIRGILIFSFIGLLIPLFLKSDFKKQFPRKEIIILIFFITFMLISMLVIQYTGNRGTGRNLLASSAVFGIFLTIGLSYYFQKNNMKKLLLIPLAILVITNVSIFIDMNEKFEHGFPRDPIHDVNHDLKIQIWLGEGTLPFKNEPVTRLRNNFLEDNEHDTVLIMHPNPSGTKWWNFTMNVPENIDYDLDVTYGFLSNAKGRDDPVEFRTFFNNELMFQNSKSFTGSTESFKIDLEEYNGENIQVSLSTSALDYGNNHAWSFFRLKFIK